MTELSNAELTAALDDLRRRVRRMEAGEPAPPPSQAGRWWLLDGLPAGAVAFGGRVSLPGSGDVVWQMEHRAQDVLASDLAHAATVLAALGHPLRLEILRALLEGARTLAELQEIPGSGTSGQLHHHLRELRGAGLVVSRRRNDYAVATDRVVAIVVMLQAALGRDVPQGPDPPS